MNSWHPSDDRLLAWSRQEVGVVEATSLEQHVPSCLECQEACAEAATDPMIEQVWGSISHQIEPQPLNLVGRAMSRAGFTRGDAFIVSSAPSLSASFISGILLALSFALFAGASEPRTVSIFLTLAPLAPLAGMAFVFGGETDPLYELTVASPYSKFRLLLWRCAAVLACTIPFAVLAALSVHGSWWVAAVWLVPALAFCSTTLALARWFEPQSTAAVIAVGWALAQGPEIMRGHGTITFTTTALVLYTLALAAGVLVFVRQGRTGLLDWRTS